MSVSGLLEISDFITPATYIIAGVMVNFWGLQARV